MPCASIQKIIGKEQIPWADKIEIVKVLGWQCIVSKEDNFQVNDKVIFIEIDSIVPERPEFEFLRKYNYRVKTMKLKGVVSQGLVLPINKFLLGNYDIGTDVSDQLDIKHWEKPIPVQMQGQIAGQFPVHLVPKTNEERLQNFPDVINELYSTPCYVSVKLDGCSGSFILHNDKFYICSRNNIMKDNEENKENLYVRIAKKYDIENKFRNYGKNIAIQGEIVGPSIQGNPLQLKNVDIFFFNAYDIDNRKYYNYNELKRVIDELGLKMVPVIYDNILLPIELEDFIEMSKGVYEGTNHPREGIVIRSLVEKYSNALEGRLSFKCINPEYKDD